MNKGFITIDGKKYAVEVKNGKRYIEGELAEEWITRQPDDLKYRFAIVGKAALQKEKYGFPKMKLQEVLDLTKANHQTKEEK